MEIVATPPVEVQPPLLEPEVIPASTGSEQTSPQRPSALQVAGWCALAAGAAVLSYVALKGMGRFLSSPAGEELVNEVLRTSFSRWSSSAREVFVGPRGGRYRVTANGTKSYNVP